MRGRNLLVVLCIGFGFSQGQAGSGDRHWFDQGRPTALARQAVQLLSDAPSHGLDAADYGADALGRELDAAGEGAWNDAAGRARWAQAAESASARLLHDLKFGRLALQHSLSVIEDLLRDAIARGDLGAAMQRVTPPLPQYARLREALARTRAIVGHAAWQESLPPLPVDGRANTRGRLAPGETWLGLALLQQRLLAWGDLQPQESIAIPEHYAGALVRATQSFQQRHGLAADGVIGRATWRALQVAPELRVRQLELALERLRTTPLLQHARTIVVNIPEFVLRAYEVRDGRIDVRHTMKVVVGKAMDTRTPRIAADLRFIEFSPYWNVPASIARHELVPLLRRRSELWVRDGYEFVDAAGRIDTAYSGAKLDAALAGSLRIRQRPGPRNPLGDIKFVFPNPQQVYLHHTPATRLFEQERRDLSHGCIRVEQPVQLATFVLQDMPAWNESRIRQAMAQGTSATLAVAQPVHVLIAYGTALVKESRLYFFDDIYGLDRQLDAALQRVATARKAARP